MAVNNSTHDKVMQVARMTKQLIKGDDSVTPLVLRLLEIASLQEIKEELSGIDARLNSIDAELKAK